VEPAREHPPVSIMASLRAFLLVLCACTGHAEQQTAGANPIRKIVTLLQNMQKEVEGEGKKEQELHDKFMCFCAGNNADLNKKIADASAAIDQLGAKLKAEEAEKVQIAQELKDHQSDRVGAQDDLSEAQTLREKEAAAFAAEKADSETNIGMMAKAIPALEKGMGGASLMQLPFSDRLHKLVENYPNVDSNDRRQTLSFLEQSDSAPQSGQIVGILKAMKDDMEAELKEAVADDAKATAGFADLKASKEKEVEVATEAIETKTGRAGETAVSVVQTADSLEDTQNELADTQKFVQQLESECATKEQEFAARQKLRAEEVAAISQAIGILNDDDALDVFKKAAASALVQDGVAFLQRSDSLASRVHKAQSVLATAATKAHSQQLNLLLFTLNSKLKLGAKGMEGVIKMIDDMVVLLGKDQADDDTQRGYCQDELEKSGDEQKASGDKKAQVEAAISESTDAVETLGEEVATLQQDIKDLDKAVAQATEQRKEEHADFLESQQLSEAALQLLDKAKNRMQKFYNPTLYKAPPKTEMSAEEKIMQAGSFVQISAHDDAENLGEYKKSEKSAGVIGLMDMMSKDLSSDMKDAEYEEKTSQSDYGKLMADSEETRRASSKSIVAKSGSKATLEGKLADHQATLTATDEDLALIATTIQDLHAACDFLLQNYDLRREARTNEVESLKNAKAILSGANFR